ncbi:MAG: helix-turn-helix transcriptional regulator, partial [Rubrobacteraceae bacterium]
MESLKALREQRGLSRETLAVGADMSPVTLWRYETGQRSPTVDQLEKLAEVMGVEVGDLLPKVQASLWPEEEPERRNREPSDAQRRFAKVDELAAEYLMGRAEKHDAEVMDPNSPHFANATAAA